MIRQGAPFLDAIRRMKQHLLESGILTNWMSDVIKQRVREARRNSKESHQDTAVTEALLPTVSCTNHQSVYTTEHILETISKKWYMILLLCQILNDPSFSQLGSGEVVLGLDHLQGAFYLLFAGLLVSLITLLFEQASAYAIMRELPVAATTS